MNGCDRSLTRKTKMAEAIRKEIVGYYYPTIYSADYLSEYVSMEANGWVLLMVVV